MRGGVDHFCAFHGSSGLNYAVGRTGRAICTKTFVQSRGVTVGVAAGAHLRSKSFALFGALTEAQKSLNL